MCCALRSRALFIQGTLGHLTTALGSRGYRSHFQKGKLRHRTVRSLVQGHSVRRWQSSDLNPDLFDSRALFSA